jgi:hypothetical protein
MELETAKIEFSDEENEVTACLQGRLQLSDFEMEHHSFYFFIDYRGLHFTDMKTVIMLSVILLNVVSPPNLIC